MFMCRSLEEFRDAYLHLTQKVPPAPDDGGPRNVVPKPEPNDSDDDYDDDDDDDDHQPRCFQLVVKREEYWPAVSSA